MIDLVIERAADPAQEKDLLKELSAHVTAVKASAGAAKKGQIEEIEARVRAAPQSAFRFDASGAATLIDQDGDLPAGHFETPTLGALRARVISQRNPDASGRVRLWVLDGESPATDIGSLQASAGPETLFQVASQFNCLEAAGPTVVPIAHYLTDPTQGPRASISAYSGTLLRHYAAPGMDGQRFVQRSGGPQINLLDAFCDDGMARVNNGYLRSDEIEDPAGFATALEDRFNEIRVGVHEAVPVLLGYNWYGAVDNETRIGQVFTSTLAGGRYSGVRIDSNDERRICTALLRGAYMGTLLAAANLGRTRVVLTLIGGGVFGNPIQLIWESICWAITEVEPLLSTSMEVVVNGRNLSQMLPVNDIMPAVRQRGGAAIVFGPNSTSVLR